MREAEIQDHSEYIDLAVEKLNDPSDIATTNELINNHATLQNVIAAFKRRPLDPEFDGVHCVECGVKIASKRLKNVRTDKCTDCATIEEQKNKLRGRQGG